MTQSNMAFDSLLDAMSSPAETSDKIAYAAWYVGTWLVAVTIVGGVPYVFYKSGRAAAKAESFSASVNSILLTEPAFGPEDEEAFDFDVSWLPDEFRDVLNARREWHLAFWKQYGITSSVEKQAHFTQILLRTNVLVPDDPQETLIRMAAFYWLIGVAENTELDLSCGNPLEIAVDEDEEEGGIERILEPWTPGYDEVLREYWLASPETEARTSNGTNLEK